MRRPPLFSIVLWAAAGVLALGVGGWWVLFRSDAPPRAELRQRPSSVELPAAAPADATSPTVEGDWVVRRGTEVFAGYRVTEQWGGDRFDKAAVGRTPAVEGELRIRDGRLVSARIEADLGQLRSDQSARDALLRERALETDRYPSARFELTEPVDLPDAAPGEVVDLTLSGDLTLHGRTETVEVQLQARLNGSSIDVAGATVVALRDFGIDPPSTPFISVAGAGEVEVQLTFVRA